MVSYLDKLLQLKLLIFTQIQESAEINARLMKNDICIEEKEKLILRQSDLEREVRLLKKYYKKFKCSEGLMIFLKTLLVFVCSIVLIRIVGKFFLPDINDLTKLIFILINVIISILIAFEHAIHLMKAKVYENALDIDLTDKLKKDD